MILKNKKQAYLIIAHKDDTAFKTLLHMLDDEDNDIFIHMDKKNKNYNQFYIEKQITKSKVFHTRRSSVSWGDYSMINAEYLLLKEATSRGCYNYYHLLSGQDLPIKTQKEIRNFFEKHVGKEFISFDCNTFQFQERVCYYYPLQKVSGRGHMQKITNLLLYIQKKAKIKRNKNIKFQKGSQWFSITDDLARYVINQEKWIKKVFKYSFCADEIFLQTIVYNSDFINSLYYKNFDDSNEGNMRYIDWIRGNPYVFKSGDIDEIKQSNLLFARKFDSQLSEEIIQEIYKNYKN